MPVHSSGYRPGLTWTKWRRPGLCGMKVAPEETLPALTEKVVKEVRACSFDILPDDIIVSILAMVCAKAKKPSDFLSVRITCRRLNALTHSPEVLQNASLGALWPRPSLWCSQVERYMWQAACAGSTHAAYTLGMVLFYCRNEMERVQGALLLARSAVSEYKPALYALAVIFFNGSGIGRDQKNLEAGVSLCCRAAAQGNENAIRELGHCLQHGYGVRREVAAGRHVLCLLEINAQQLGAQAALTAVSEAALPPQPHRPTTTSPNPLAHMHERRTCAGLPPVTLAERRAASGGGVSSLRNHNRNQISNLISNQFSYQKSNQNLSQVSDQVPNQIPEYDVAQDRARLDKFLRANKFEQEEVCILAGKNDKSHPLGLRDPISWGSFKCTHFSQHQSHGVSISQVLGAALSAIQSACLVEVPRGVTAEVVAQAVVWVEQLTRMDSDTPEFKSLVSKILPHPHPPSLPEPSTDLAHAVMVAHARANGSLPCGSSRFSDLELRMCSHVACGRIETRQHEFRRCSACGAVNYCSTVCQEHHWVARHRDQCPGMAVAMAANGVLPHGVDMDDYDVGNGVEMALTPRGGQHAVFGDVDRGVEGEAMEVDEK